ncbi:hypothetical protein MPSEU_000155100 [Mayamaea pseudoterrestris]|nr:hypothetical protein MPSEU_000155100 [Mayamaea pseudoterrestris]
MIFISFNFTQKAIHYSLSISTPHFFQALQRLNMSSLSTPGTSSSSSPLPFISSLFSLKGRTAIITGGGTGIGAALALNMARAGATVVVVGRRLEPLQATCQMIQDQVNLDHAVNHGSNSNQPDKESPRQIAYYATCDLSKLDEIPKLIEHVTNMTETPPTILVNNAGVNVRQAPSNLTAEHWEQTLTLTLTAPFFLARAMSESMRQEHYGRIISIASLQSFQAFPDSLPYAAGKSGVLGLTRALAEAYSTKHGYENVTANAVAPGYVATELTKSVFADVGRANQLAARTMIGRNSVPEDLVGPCVFLASPAGAYVTGQCLPVDGGFTSLGMR